MSAPETSPAVKAVSQQNCLFITVDDGANPMSARLLRRLDAEMREVFEKNGVQPPHAVCILRTAAEARALRTKNTVAVYDSNDYDGYYSPDTAPSSPKYDRPDWVVGSPGYVVRLKKDIQKISYTLSDREGEIVNNRLAMCATQLVRMFSWAGAAEANGYMPWNMPKAVKEGVLRTLAEQRKRAALEVQEANEAKEAPFWPPQGLRMKAVTQY